MTSLYARVAFRLTLLEIYVCLYVYTHHDQWPRRADETLAHAFRVVQGEICNPFIFFLVVAVVFCVPPHRLSFLVCRAQNGDDESVERERLATNEDQDDADKEFRLLCIRPHP